MYLHRECEVAGRRSWLIFKFAAAPKPLFTCLNLAKGRWPTDTHLQHFEFDNTFHTCDKMDVVNCVPTINRLTVILPSILQF